MIEHVQRAKGAVEQALRHHRAAVDAFADGNDEMVERHHRRLGESLRNAAAALSAAIPATPSSSQVQTSAGIDNSGGATGGRQLGSPLLSGDVLGWLDRAKTARRL